MMALNEKWGFTFLDQIIHKRKFEPRLNKVLYSFDYFNIRLSGHVTLDKGV